MDGLHVIMSASQKGGVAKSTSIAEFAAAFKLAGIPVVVATMEASKEGKGKNDYLEKILRGTDVMEIDGHDVMTVGDSLGEAMDEAEEQGAVLLLDVPGALFNSGNNVFERVVSSRLLQDLDTLTLLSPVSNIVEDFKYAQLFIDSVEELNICEFDVWYRGWSRPEVKTKLNDMPEWQALIDAGKNCIEVDNRHPKEIAAVEGKNDMEVVPGLVELPAFFSKNGKNLARFQRKSVEGVCQNIEKIAAFVRANFKPLASKKEDNE